MNDPRMMAQMLAQQQAQGPSDEDMLGMVQQGMGAPEQAQGQGPPPGSGMKWENLEEDQAALLENPTPENIAAFTQYWGEENLPEGLESGEQAVDTEEGAAEY